MTQPIREYRTRGRFAVDLNFDGGEGADDAALLRSVSTVNIACGGHAGDERSMRQVARLALSRGVAICAHPSYEDRENFGRAPVALAPAAIEDLVKRQVEALRNVVREEEGQLTGVKPHGALYHAAAADGAVAAAVARAIREVSPDLVVVSSPGSKLLEAARAIVFERRLVARDGQTIPVAADTLCVHGDTPNADAIAAAVRKVLVDAEVIVRSLRGWRPAA